MWTKLTCVMVTAAALAACAQPVMPAASHSLADQESVARSTPISAGASDAIGAFIPASNQALRLEASAAPAH